MDDSVLALIKKFQTLGEPESEVGERSSVLTADAGAIADRRDASLGLLVFSKDRPFQLLQLLLSLEEVRDPVHPVKVIVLYSCSDVTGSWLQHYRSISQRFAPQVEFHLEKDFSSDLLEIMNKTFEGIDVIGFCVDDLIFTSQTPLHSYANMILGDGKFGSTNVPFAFHTKLHPGICFSHTRSEICAVPTLTQMGKSGSGPLTFSYDVADGTGDWHYPFDLCGSLYRKSDVLAILATACDREDLGRASFRNPNLLEKTGNQIYWEGEMCRKFRSCLCASRRHLSVLTVNKVQTVFDVPIYNTEGGDLSSLNNYFVDVPGNGSAICVQEVDTSYYGNDPRSMSVHVGGLHFRTSTAPIQTVKSEGVSLLIPVYNGEEYLESTLQSAIEKPQGCTFEIVVVDDGSTDGTGKILQRAASRAEEKGIPLKILTLEFNKGLIHALMEGIKLCSFDLIARLDADDLLEDHRLSRQKAFLEHNREIHVVGSQAVQIDGSGELVPRLIKGIPTHPVLVAWEMHFRCCILHPSVMYRRSVVEECGSYASSSESASAVEDYHLWFRALSKHPFSIANLPDVLIRLRRHEASKSSRENSKLLEQSRKLRLSAVQEMLGEGMVIDQSSLDVLCQPERYLEVSGQVSSALRLLDTMFEEFQRMSFPQERTTGGEDKEDEKQMLIHALEKSKTDKQERLCAAAIKKGLAAEIPEGLRELKHRAEVRALKARILGLA